MKYFKIKNWERYQHRDALRSKHKGTPMVFIRVDTRLLWDETMFKLTPNQELTWYKLLLYSGITRNKLECNPDFLKSVLRLKRKPNLAVYEELGLIEPWSASSLRADLPAGCAPREEKRREEKSREELLVSAERRKSKTPRKKKLVKKKQSVASLDPGFQPVTCDEKLFSNQTKPLLEKIKITTQQSWLQLYEDPEWIKREIIKAWAWIQENPSKAPKSRFGRFMTSWLERGWERHRRYNGSRTTNQFSNQTLSGGVPLRSS